MQSLECLCGKHTTCFTAACRCRCHKIRTVKSVYKDGQQMYHQVHSAAEAYLQGEFWQSQPGFTKFVSVEILHEGKWIAFKRTDNLEVLLKENNGSKANESRD